MIEPNEFAKRMAELSKYAADEDEEIAHKEADALMCEVLTDLGYGEGAAIFDSMGKWYA